MTRPAHIAIVTVSDRAASGEYEDKGGPGAESWLRDTIISPMQITRVIVPDGRETVAEALRDLCDNQGADLILVTGGTGPAPRDLTPEAVSDIAHREYPGFGEEMRRASLTRAEALLFTFLNKLGKVSSERSLSMHCSRNSKGGY